MENLTRIQSALAALLNRENDDAFVVIEHEASGKFVQFSGSASEMLLLDLPAQTLSEQEFYRAVDFFRQIGVTGEEFSVLDQPGGRVVGQQFSFNVSYRSPEEAARTAVSIFRDVYQLSEECDLLITEN